MIRLAWAFLRCGLSLYATGCYLHHERSAPEATIDATIDANVEASVDAGVDAPIDATLDAELDSGPDAASCLTFTVAPEPILSPVDIVWAIDSSMSMQDERARLQATINDFARRVRQRVPDLHVVVLTSENIVPAPLGTDDDSYLFVPQAIASNDTLSVLLDRLPSFSHFLRDDALLHLVVVSDDDSTLPADQFQREADLLFGKPYTLHAIASPDVNGAPCRSAVPSSLCLQTGIQAVCGAAAVGVEYYRAAAATGGLSIDVCLDDWTQVIGPLSDAVVGSDPVPCHFSLPFNNQGKNAIHVEATLNINGVSPQPLTRVSSSECNDTLSFFVSGEEWAPFNNLTLCPTSCEAVTRSRGEIELRLDCPPTRE